MIETIVKRDGRVERFDPHKIQQAVFRCLLDGIGETASTSGQIADEITSRVIATAVQEGGDLTVEAVQDLVEQALMAAGYFQAAKAYILYRAEHQKARLVQVLDPGEPWYTEVQSALQRAGEGLSCVDLEEVAREVLRSLFPGATRKDLQQALVLAARARIERDPDYDQLAVRLLLDRIYEEALETTSPGEALSVYRERFRNYLQKGVAVQRLSPALLAQFDLEPLLETLEPERDREFRYFGLQTLYDRYLLHDEEQRYETPQFFWMRIAMGLALAEPPADRTRRAIEFYRVMAHWYLCPSTPTLFNAGTLYPQLSSCFLNSVEDDLRHILMSVHNNGMLSKWSGGLGTDVTNVRAVNAWIKKTNGPSLGLIPFLKMFNACALAVNQGSKRKGAVKVSLEVWHLEIEEFIELRRNTGDERRRCHDLHLAGWIPDLFMKRVEAGESWTLFSPDEVPDLHHLSGREFETRYEYYEEQARAGKLRQHRIVPALDLHRRMMAMLFETGHPWQIFKDAFNARNPQDHVGVIHHTNLCSEVALNTGRPKASHLLGEAEEIAVCTLASVNLARHLTSEGTIRWERLAETVRVGQRMLDNVIDLNMYELEEARRGNQRHRPVGMGIMGFQDLLYRLGTHYADGRAIELADETMEFISYHVLLASADLARERGPYSTFTGSKWDRGLLPIDTIDLLEEERGVPVEMDRRSRLAWSVVRERIAEDGLRNCVHLAIAPTATISDITGCFPSNECLFSNLRVRSTMSGEFTVLNEYLVRDLKARGLWDQDLLDDLKYYDGSVQEIERVPEELKRKYRTVWEIEPRWLIEAASRRQKWIDQAQSTNLYLASPRGKDLSDMYFLAWRKGLKSTYYLRTRAATSVEKSTLDVNARAIQPRWMKERSASADVQVDRGAPVPMCRLDNPDCEACQ